MMRTPRQLAALFAVLMVLSTAAFVIGVTVEQNQGQTETAVEETHSDERSEAHEEGENHEGEPVESHSEESETIGGIDLESTPLIVLGAALSLALAGLVLRWPRREVFGAAALFCLGFALLDGREVAHQLDEQAATVAVLAALALALHLGAAAVAGLALARSRDDRAARAVA
ncbi:hypothetical protein [Nocardioides sp. XL1]|uniref:hypothetical protein n=1 Tax=Nocardioides sp. XL1 TaxID=2003120 RepID=UPI0005A00831|nr:hypothetical protein [Nocardioides sp. XL1]